jgi:biopolymer transport protein ExbB
VGALLWKEQILNWMKGDALPDSQDKLKELAEKYPCLEADLLQVLITAKTSNRNELDPLMASFLAHKRIELDKNLGFLGSMGSNAPFIGLFGTVLGIIKAFHDLGEQNMESGGAQSVSSGLSEALVATAVGLLVAIPAVLFFNFFNRKIKMIVARAESLGNFVISLK